MDRARASGIQVTGWMGTVKHPRYLKDEDGENLNRLAIFMRGKLAQEDILADFGQKEIYADYLVGEIHCDDLDDDGKDDIATSSRQSLKDDDPRFEALRDIVYQELRYVAGRWSDWRRGDGTKMFVGEVPEVLKWLEDLKGDMKKKAERWIGRCGTRSNAEDRGPPARASAPTDARPAGPAPAPLARPPVPESAAACRGGGFQARLGPCVPWKPRDIDPNMLPNGLVPR